MHYIDRFTLGCSLSMQAGLWAVRDFSAMSPPSLLMNCVIFTNVFGVMFELCCLGNETNQGISSYSICLALLF